MRQETATSQTLEPDLKEQLSVISLPDKPLVRKLLDPIYVKKTAGKTSAVLSESVPEWLGKWHAGIAAKEAIPNSERESKQP